MIEMKIGNLHVGFGLDSNGFIVSDVQRQN